MTTKYEPRKMDEGVVESIMQTEIGDGVTRRARDAKIASANKRSYQTLIGQADTLAGQDPRKRYRG